MSLLFLNSSAGTFSLTPPTFPFFKTAQDERRPGCGRRVLSLVLHLMSHGTEKVTDVQCNAGRLWERAFVCVSQKGERV